MILPIVAFGDPVLRKKGEVVLKEDKDLPVLIENMWETMYNASGVGLAAPQINKAIRLFIIDTTVFAEDQESDITPLKEVFINPRIIKEKGKEWLFNEGCLSIPEIREDIARKFEIEIEYFDVNFKQHIKKFDGISARVIQHEYDHIQGILFTDKISPLKRKIIEKKLSKISKGNINSNYKMLFNK